MDKIVLLPVFGSYGDVLPIVSTASNLQRMGYRPVIFTNEYFQGAIEKAEVEAVYIDSKEIYIELISDPKSQNPFYALKLILGHIIDHIPDYYSAMKQYVAEHATPESEVVVLAHTAAYSGHVFSELEKTPIMTLHLAPSSFKSFTAPPRVLPMWFGSKPNPMLVKMAYALLESTYSNPVITRKYNQVRKKMGLAGVKNFLSEKLHDVDKVVGLFPKWFAYDKDQWLTDVNCTNFPMFDQSDNLELDAKVLQFIEQSDRPVVAFTSGTAAGFSHKFYQTSVDACVEGNLSGILLSSYDDQVPKSLPDNVIHCKYAPYTTLLPKIDAFVNHGGVGALSTAIAAGVPQLIRPTAYDQFDNARRVSQLNLGRELSNRAYKKPKRVADAINDMISNPDVKKACATYSKEINKTYFFDDLSKEIEQVLACAH